MEMDERAFAEMSKQVAAAPTRRAMLRTLSGGMAAAAMATLHRQAPVVAEDAGDEAFCRPRKVPCSNKLQCCARKCVQGTLLGQPAMVCGCNKKGKSCIKGLGQSCCSGRCKKGKCS
jgi:hypothetical protein